MSRSIQSTWSPPSLESLDVSAMYPPAAVAAILGCLRANSEEKRKELETEIVSIAAKLKLALYFRARPKKGQLLAGLAPLDAALKKVLEAFESLDFQSRRVFEQAAAHWNSQDHYAFDPSFERVSNLTHYAHAAREWIQLVHDEHEGTPMKKIGMEAESQAVRQLLKIWDNWKPKQAVMRTSSHRAAFIDLVLQPVFAASGRSQDLRSVIAEAI